MFILLFVIAVVLIVLAVLNEDLAEGFGILGGLIGFIALIGIFVNIGLLVRGRTLDDKIAMYEQENTAIEQSVDVLVKDYYKHESDTYSSLKPENAVLFASAYPELQSNELATKQLEIYVDNNNKIKELKEDQINLSKNRFWLYFGR
jgi:hypothetical protein